ncbi:MAG: polysaccharide export protein [Fibrobacteres bacterium]|nr:polysaccharide export protein [Fibrobacterota bacterium]
MSKFFAFFILAFICFPEAARNEYVLRAGDEISIRVIEHAEFSQKSRIRPDGKINYPVIGEIDVAGLTTDQLVKIMEEKLAPYVNNVVVSISIEQYFSNRIYVLGDVGKPGELQVFEPTDVLKILAISGGLKNPKARNIKIIRANGDINEIDLQILLDQKGANQEEIYLLYPGDTMYIPPKRQIPWAMITTILSVISLTLSVTTGLMNFGS